MHKFFFSEVAGYHALRMRLAYHLDYIGNYLYQYGNESVSPVWYGNKYHLCW